MDNKTIETIDHNYDPVNKYIDEKARLRRTRSVWGYTRSLALFLIALGIFLILAAYAYYIFKKPHEQFFTQNDIIKSEKLEKNLSDDINTKDDEIKHIEEQIQSSPENEKLKKELEALKKEKKELEKKLENVVYDETVSIFKRKDIDSLTVTTGFQWNKVDDLRYGKKHNSDWCYIEKGQTTLKYWFGDPTDQSISLNELDITEAKAKTYRKYCKN